ncbi:hypothetical protein B6A42_21010 [Vibrio coralliilyticus]|nr:hypothetical protein B6A42_21010 [Vibrio coralliilyticus]
MGTLKGVSTAIRIKFSSWLEHSWGISSLTVLTIIASVLVVYLSGVLISKWRTPATHIIYGTWVEQFVPSYTASTMNINQHGVSFGRGFVTTQLHFDGNYLEFHRGKQLWRFKMLNDEYTEMRLMNGSNYQPIYRIQKQG